MTLEFFLPQKKAAGYSTEEMFLRYIKVVDSSRALELGKNFEKLRIDCI